MNVASWIVGLSLIVLTITLHTTVVVMMAFGMESRIRARIEKHTLVPQKAIPAVIGSIGFVAVALALMHGLEGVLWASAYRSLGAFDSFADASVYSLGTMITLDIPGLVLPSRLRMISALEAVNGVMLFGISTAFIFAVMQSCISLLVRRR
ncbi:hypothetical protein [Mycolicibacterium psychrotolerans]|uniref:Ion channel n=1 Tax=Mycolicibacterium psychrotolerans TaxID=216929 RepID=A0A7I7MAH3_9MYCO|nr:hypothetical protein [Mycolicibacterium psychrotolerans]BBX68483.1 hypothetical protein MPSYJ_19440 [Mycolicibacterium psychrotolerans]